MLTRTLLLSALVLALGAAPSANAAPGPADVAFDQVMKSYLALHAHLTTDRFDDSSRKEAAVLNVASTNLHHVAGPASALAQTMIDRSAELTQASLSKARTSFASLSEAIDAYIKGSYHGATKYYRFFCDMVKKPWAQPKSAPVLNPFYDASMRNCGRLVP